MRIFFRGLFFVLLIFAIISIACIGGGDGWRSSQQTQAAINAASTFGAEQFHLQLTAMSEGTSTP